MGNLIIIMGATASGKDTFAKKLYENGVNRFVSYTTRPMRNGEEEGREYHFVTKETFDDDLSNDRIIEHREYNVANGDTWYYYYKKGDLDLSDDTTYSCIADVHGTAELVKYFGKANTKVIYLSTPLDICLNRALARELMSVPTIKEICRRMISDIDEIVQNPSTLELADIVVDLSNWDNVYDTLYDLGIFKGVRLHD